MAVSGIRQGGVGAPNVVEMCVERGMAGAQSGEDCTLIAAPVFMYVAYLPLLLAGLGRWRVASWHFETGATWFPITGCSGYTALL